jgi:hypothetical protein
MRRMERMLEQLQLPLASTDWAHRSFPGATPKSFWIGIEASWRPRRPRASARLCVNLFVNQSVNLLVSQATVGSCLCLLQLP